jgi:AAA domain
LRANGPSRILHAPRDRFSSRAMIALTPSAARAPHQACGARPQSSRAPLRTWPARQVHHSRSGPLDVRRETRWVTGRILITGPSGSGKSTLAHYFRERGVIAVDGDEVRGLGGPVDLDGRPLRHITKEQWRDIADWRHFWNESVLKRFLAPNPNVVLFGASDNLFDLDLARVFDRRIYLRATWSVVRARLNSSTRDNDWGRDSQPAQRDWVRKANREWPVRAKASEFEFIDAEWSPARIFRQVCETRADTVGTHRHTSRSNSSRSGPRPARHQILEAGARPLRPGRDRESFRGR